MTIVGLSLRVDVAQRKQLEVAINYWHGARNVFQRCIVRTVLLDMYHIHTCIREYYEHAGKRGVFHEVERLMKYWIPEPAKPIYIYRYKIILLRRAKVGEFVV